MGLRERALVPDASGGGACPRAPERKRYTMNRNAKGAIAVGAATLLLLGGGGTFALWNDSANLSAGTVDSGQLTLEAAAGNGTWYTDEDLTDEITSWGNEGAGYAIVPGDTVYWESEELTITAEGDNLSFAFLAELESTLASDPLFEGIEISLESVDQTASNPNIVLADTVTSGNQATFNPNDLPVGTQILSVSSDEEEVATYTVVISVHFDDAVDGLDQQLAEFDLTDAVLLTLQQVILP